jgi:hypothetical protein
MDVNGALIKGNFTVPITWTNNVPGSIQDGWNLIGNPYACSYSWKNSYQDASTFSKLDPTIWLFNAKTNSYVSYNTLSQAGTLTNGIIPSGQSFWVRGNAANPTVTFKEDFKIVDQGINYLSTKNDNAANEISVVFVKDSVNSDQVSIKYLNGSTKNYDQ